MTRKCLPARERILCLLLTAALLMGLPPVTTAGLDDVAGTDALVFSSETCVYSIATEQFLRKATEYDTQKWCGPDGYVTIQLNVLNPGRGPVTMEKAQISIDGGKLLGWGTVTVGAGRTKALHVFHTNRQFLTAGAHSAVVYVAGRPVYTCAFEIPPDTDRNWAEVFDFPTEAEKEATPKDHRAPYLSAWADVGGTDRYSEYSVDIKADYLPPNTYCCGTQFKMDLSGLGDRVVSGNGTGYAGLQRWDAGKGGGSILSFWDIVCAGEGGETTTIRAKRTFAASEPVGSDDFGNEGSGAHTLLPYDFRRDAGTGCCCAA